MKIVGLITEYNPFHNGHKYHIEEAKSKTGADYCIAVMSGNFVQRGTPAVIDKYQRTEMALRNGVDLVIELPVCYATGSAEYFAHGAVSILNKLGVIDYLCFGSETGDINLLEQAVKLVTNAPDSFHEHLQDFLKDGMTYPAARSKALINSMEEYSKEDRTALTEVLTQPNNILGIEYLKALQTFASDIIPVTIKREVAPYHEPTLSDSCDGPVISSATAIRKSIQSSSNTTPDDFNEIRHSIPEDVYKVLSEQYMITYPVTEEDFCSIIKYKLLSETSDTLSTYMDITSDLADRMKNISDFNLSLNDLISKIKTKNTTLTRINRAMIHLLLNIRKETLHIYKANGYASYARILGIRREAFHLLRQINNIGQIPLISKVSKAGEQLDSLGLSMLSEDIFATHLYNQIVYQKYKTHMENEFKHGFIIL